jgi:uncharacterized membrane-anchored protein YhcB (DUF1043 family)
MDSFLSLLVGLALGIVFFLWDHKKGQKWYKRWYDLSHKEALNEDRNDSFVVNQPFSKKLIPAIILTLIFSYVTWVFGDLNPIIAALTGLIMLIGVLIGLYVGPFMVKTVPSKLKQANKALKKIDAIEQDILDEHSVVEEAEIEEAPKPEETKDEPKKDDDWRKGVKDFLDK